MTSQKGNLFTKVLKNVYKTLYWKVIKFERYSMLVSLKVKRVVKVIWNVTCNIIT